MHWINGLSQLFGATVNQETLESAAQLMVTVSISDEEYHIECLTLFDAAIDSTVAGNDETICCINHSGYKVNDRDSALELLIDFKKIYLSEYERQCS